MTVLVTGLRGFTGQYLKTELEAHGQAVAGLQSDLTNAAAVTAEIAQLKPTTVVHLASIAFVGHGDANDFYHVNLVGTRNLLGALAALKQKPDCVLLASSANIYGNTSGGILKENTAPNPANDYAVSKLAMEYMAHLWMKKLPIVIARPFNYTGIGQSESFLIPKIVSHFKRRAPDIELGNLDVWRDFSDVRTVVQVYRRLLEICPAGEIVNVCSGKIHSLREVLILAKTITGHTLDIKVNQAFVRPNEVKTLPGDPTHLHKLLGEISHIPLSQTLRWMLNQNYPLPLS